MSASALDLALAHYDDRRRLARAAAAAGLAQWGQVRPGQLSRSWLDLLPRVVAIVQGAQLAAASSANWYVADVLELQGRSIGADGTVEPSAFAGIASDGRPLDSLLLNPVIAVKTAIAKGMRARRAMATGRAALELTIRTQVADAGRVADGVAVAVRPRTGYVRMVVGASCARCVILAGRFYRYSNGFARHPQCDCVHIPADEDTAGDFTTDPRKAFDEGLVHGLSKADEQAVLDGADLAQVVNARQGMYVAGARKLTRTGTSRRGLAGRRLGGAARLMPEQIYRESDSRDEAVRLLKQHGFIV